MADSTRRTFLKSTTAAGASLLLTGTRASGKILGANDRLRIAVAGLNGRGQSHLSGWMEQDNVEPWQSAVASHGTIRVRHRIR